MTLTGKLQPPDLKESDDHGDNHETIDDSVRNVVGQDGKESKLFLVDQSKVQDEGDDGGRQGQEEHAQSRPNRDLLRSISKAHPLAIKQLSSVRRSQS